MIDLKEIGSDGSLDYTSILETLISKQAKFHQDCRVRFNDEKMLRLVSSRSDDDLGEPSTKKHKKNPTVLHQDPDLSTPPRQQSDVSAGSHRDPQPLTPSRQVDNVSHRDPQPLTPSRLVDSVSPRDPYPLTPSRQVFNVSHRDPSSLTPSRQVFNVSHRDPNPLTPSRQVDNVSHRDPYPLTPSRQVFNVSHRDPNPLTPSRQVDNVSHRDPSLLTPSRQVDNVSHRDYVSRLDHHTTFSPVRKDVTTVENITYRGLESFFHSSTKRVHMYSDIQQVFKEQLKGTLSLPADAELYDTITSRMNQLTLVDKFNTLKSQGCSDIFSTPDPADSGEIVVCFNKDIFGLLKGIESSDTDCAAGVRASILKRQPYAFNGRFTKEILTTYAPPAALLTFLSKTIYGKDVQPYTLAVIHIATMIVYNQKLYRSDCSVSSIDLKVFQTSKSIPTWVGKFNQKLVFTWFISTSHI